MKESLLLFVAGQPDYQVFLLGVLVEQLFLTSAGRGFIPKKSINFSAVIMVDFYFAPPVISCRNLRSAFFALVGVAISFKAH